MFKHFVKQDAEGSQTSTGGAAPVGEAPPASDPPEVNWGEMADESLPEDPPADPVNEEVPTGEPPKTDQPTEPPKTEEPPKEPVVEPPQPPVKQPTPEEAAAQEKQFRDQLRDELRGIYEKELSEDQKAQLIAEPEKVIPHLMAQAAMDAVAIAMRQIQQQLPNVIAQHTSQHESAKSAWGEFDTAHPDLAKPEYRKVVLAAINTVKATGQKLPKADAMAAVARTARAILNLPSPGTPAAKSEASTSAPVAPFNPVARGKSVPAKPAKPAAENPWVQFLD